MRKSMKDRLMEDVEIEEKLRIGNFTEITLDDIEGV